MHTRARRQPTTRQHPLQGREGDSHLAVAALALGLSFADRTGDDVVQELLDHHDPELLRAARDHLQAQSPAPAKVRATATELLERALRRG